MKRGGDIMQKQRHESIGKQQAPNVNINDVKSTKGCTFYIALLLYILSWLFSILIPCYATFSITMFFFNESQETLVNCNTYFFIKNTTVQTLLRSFCFLFPMFPLEATYRKCHSMFTWNSKNL